MFIFSGAPERTEEYRKKKSMPLIERNLPSMGNEGRSR
jgi:hypothetical protein